MQAPRAPSSCAECGRAALFVAAEDAMEGFSEVAGLGHLWMQQGISVDETVVQREVLT
jgi:hypothetical protein